MYALQYKSTPEMRGHPINLDAQLIKNSIKGNKYTFTLIMDCVCHSLLGY